MIFLSKIAMKNLKAFFFALLLLASPLLQVAWCQSETEADVKDSERGDLGIVGDGEYVNPYPDSKFDPAPGVQTICYFPKNSGKLVPAGEKTELLIGMKNVGESALNIISVEASVHISSDHRMIIQNLTTQVFKNASVPPSTQATIPYVFSVSRYFPPGTFDFVGTVVYDIDTYPYQNTFYNGTIEIVEAGGFVSIESIFLVTLGISLLVLLGLWLHGQVKRISKKTKSAPKVEVGTRTIDSSLDEWLQGTAYSQPSSKSKKNK